MFFTGRHNEIFQQFFDKYFNGNSAFHNLEIQRLVGCKSIAGMNPVYGVFCARALVHGVFIDNPKLSFAEFEKEMLYRAEKLNGLLNKHRETLGKIVAEHPNPSWRHKGRDSNGLEITDDLVGRAGKNGENLLFSYFQAMSFAGISFNEQIKSFRLFSSFAPKWASSKPIRKGDFVISKTFLLHEESPLCFAIRTKDGKPVASVGGFIAFQSGQPVIHLTNIQGATKSKRESNPREIHEKLKEALGENWRVFLARQIAQYAGKKGKCVIGSLPPRFYAMGPKGKIALASDKEFLRQIRQYRQTYRKAGLHEHTDGKWRLKPLARRAPK